MLTKQLLYCNPDPGVPRPKSRLHLKQMAASPGLEKVSTRHAADAEVRGGLECQTYFWTLLEGIGTQALEVSPATK